MFNLRDTVAVSMTYKAGIIGTGGVAGMGFIGTKGEQPTNEGVRSSHAGGYAATEDIDLVAVADIDEEKLDRFGDVWDIPDEQRYLGHEAMLEAEDLDVVSVCTPTFLHRGHVVDAARSAADPDVIWCEKPIASSVSDADEMVAVCTETDTELLINHIRRFDPTYHALRDRLVDDELLGDVRSMHAGFKRELLRNGTHFVDMAAHLLDARPTAVSGFITAPEEATEQMGIEADVDDAGGAGTILLEDGAVVTVDCTVSRDYWTGMFHLVGTDGKLYVNETDGECRFWRLEDGVHVEADLGIDGERLNDLDAAFVEAASHVSDLLASGQGSHQSGEVKNRSSGEEGVEALELLIALFVSDAVGGHVDLPFDGPLRGVEIRSW